MLLIYGRNSNSNITSQLLYYVGRFLQTHSFTNARRKKYGTVRSGDPTGHDLPDTWKWFSSRFNTLHTPPIRCHWAVFEMAWRHVYLGAQTLPPNCTVMADVRSVMCQSVCARLYSNEIWGSKKDDELHESAYLKISLLQRITLLHAVGLFFNKNLKCVTGIKRKFCL